MARVWCAVLDVLHPKELQLFERGSPLGALRGSAAPSRTRRRDGTLIQLQILRKEARLPRLGFRLSTKFLGETNIETSWNWTQI